MRDRPLRPPEARGIVGISAQRITPVSRSKAPRPGYWLGASFLVGSLVACLIRRGEQLLNAVQDRAPDVAVLGAPFDEAVSYRPGARFGANHVRESSRLLRPYNPAQNVSPFAAISFTSRAYWMFSCDSERT